MIVLGNNVNRSMNATQLYGIGESVARQNYRNKDNDLESLCV